MVKKTFTGAIRGVDSEIVTCEVDVMSSQLPAFLIVGLPDKAIQEAKERIASAVKNSELEWPRKKIVVNLAPADLPKIGTSFDLPISLAILNASGFIERNLDEFFMMGELSLDGNLSGVSGVLPGVIKAKQKGFRYALVPESNVKEAGLVRGIEVYGFEKLIDVVGFINGTIQKEKVETRIEDMGSASDSLIDFSIIKGQETLKRAATIAVSGGHNLLFTGTPGSGKTMISRALPSIFPDMTFEESVELTKIYSVAGLLNPDESVIVNRPFRSPHHTSSTVSIIGGGKFPKPGEVSLAHRGVLFLDEFPEFSAFTLEALRQPLEDKLVSISRASGTLVFPANFMLVAAMNPCKCGWLGDEERPCTCTPSIIDKYKKKISGPIMDRIDLQINVKRIKIEDLARVEKSDVDSASIKAKVNSSRNIQRERLKKYKIFSNAEIKQQILEEACLIEDEARQLLLNATSKLNLSARSFFRILRVARTIADIEASESTKKIHVAEALQYRLVE